MNYYEHHIGDYIKNTAHLSMLEDGCYRRMIDAYYTREAPLPAEKRACYRLVRASSRDEKAAVDVVLEEFFTLEDDGWHQTRCDAEIAKFEAKQPAAEEKKENDKERQRKARERRKALFEALSSHGINMPWNTTTETLHNELSRVTGDVSHKPVTEPVTRDNTCTQTPDTSPQSPDTIKTPLSVASASAPSEPSPVEISAAARVCLGLKALDYGDTNPHDAKLKALLEAGLTPEEIVAIGIEARGKGKGFRWVLTTAENRRREAASIQPLPPPSSRQRPPTLTETRANTIAAMTGKQTNGLQQRTERDITAESKLLA